MIFIPRSDFSNIYVSLTKEDDQYIDTIRMEKMKLDKRHYNKTEIVKLILNLGIDVLNERYLKLDPNLDHVISQFQELVIELNGQKMKIKKTKDQVYTMLIEKGLQHMND